MIIDEHYISNLRKGDKNALEEIFKIYHSLYRFYLTYLLRNSIWVEQMLPKFYNALYCKINELQDNYNFEFWSLVLIKKMTRDFFKTNERFSKLSPLDIEEVLDIEFEYKKINDILDKNQSIVAVFTHVYDISVSNTGKLIDKEDSFVRKAKKISKEIYVEQYDDNWKNKLKDDYLFISQDTVSFNAVCEKIEFVNKQPSSEVKIQGSLKTIITFVIFIIALVTLLTILFNVGLCAPEDNNGSTNLDQLYFSFKWVFSI